MCFARYSAENEFKDVLTSAYIAMPAVSPMSLYALRAGEVTVDLSQFNFAAVVALPSHQETVENAFSFV